MVYSEILLKPKPWESRTVLVGLVAEDPKTGRIRIVRAGGAGADARQLGAADAFLASLEGLAKLTNSGKGARTVSAMLKHVPDRGTSFQFSALRTGDFNSVSAALKHCLSKNTVKPPSRRTFVPPVGHPATA